MPTDPLRELDYRIHQRLVAGTLTLYEALMHWAHSGRPLPPWLVHALEFGFHDRIAGKRTLDELFGLTPRPSKQIDKSARRLTFAPVVYHRVKTLNEDEGRPIDLEMFESIAKEMKPDFEREWPSRKTHPGGRLLKEWYLQELKLRNPKLAESRNRRKSKTA